VEEGEMRAMLLVLAVAAVLALAAAVAAHASVTSYPTCSRAAAVREGDKRGFQMMSISPSFDRPLCVDLTRDGQRDMVASEYAGGSGQFGWDIYIATPAGWRLGLHRPTDADVSFTTGHGDLRETSPIWRKTDGHCCPTGGKVYRLFHWNGERFVLLKTWTCCAKAPPPAPPPPPTPPSPPSSDSWHYYGNGIKWQWADGECQSYETSCYHIKVHATYGCRNGLYVTLNEYDDQDRILGDTIESVNSVPSGSTVLLDIVSLADNASYARLAKIDCYN
jgi:hypothetical protein